MDHPERVTDLFLGVLDFWEMNGGQKINPELADIIELHLGLAYTCGAESVIERVKEFMVTKSRHGQLPITYLKILLDEIDKNYT